MGACILETGRQHLGFCSGCMARIHSRQLKSGETMHLFFLLNDFISISWVEGAA